MHKVQRAYSIRMKNLSLVFSTHRPETLDLTARLMAEQPRILLEEPPHPLFAEMLAARLSIDDFLLELDVEYPFFARQQYTLLRRLARDGRRVLQVEPYLELLTEVQFFFADGGSPADLDRGSSWFPVYQAEREATGRLIAYYQASRQDNFEALLAALHAFARADAARFRLRDSLRAEKIIDLCYDSDPLYVEAGPMHVQLAQLLRTMLPTEWQLSITHVDRAILDHLGLQGSVFSPGDELTAHYILQHAPQPEREQLLGAQALLYAKLVQKEESSESPEEYPHTRNEYETNQLVRQLDYADCRRLYAQVRALPTSAAAAAARAVIPSR